MVSIARKNLLEDIPRFLVAQAGIVFAVSLVSIQTGILNGFTRSTVLLVEDSDVDFWVGSKEMVYFELTDPIVYALKQQIQELEGVDQAEALLLGSARWRSPGEKSTPLRIIGFEPDSQLFRPGKLSEGNLLSLQQPYAIAIDQSRESSLKLMNIGDMGSAADLPAELVAVVENSQSIVSPTFAFTSLANAAAYSNAGYTAEVSCQRRDNGDLDCTQSFAKREAAESEDSTSVFPRPAPLTLSDPITYVMVKAQAGQNLEQLKQRIESQVDSIRAYTSQEISEITRSYWRSRTNLGLVLGLGSVVGVIVGMVVVTQILYTSVTDHLKEFGTLKAMGASDNFVYWVVIEQSLWMAILGYIPGMLLCWGVSAWIASQGIIILITPLAAAKVLGIVVVMCVSSGIIAVQKVTRVDPAIVFKA